MAHSGTLIQRSLSSVWTYLVLAAVIAVGAYFASSSQAATTFLIRGDIVAIDKANGQVHVYIRHTNSAAEHFAGQIREINTSSAKFYTYDSKQRKTRSTFGTTINNLGPEVVVRGTFGGSNQFRAQWVVRNDNTVRLRGVVRGHNKDNNYLEIDLDTVQFQSTQKPYKPTIYSKDKRINVYYNDEATKFVNKNGATINEDDITNDDEKVTIDKIEVRSGGARFQAERASTITDGAWKF